MKRFVLYFILQIYLTLFTLKLKANLNFDEKKDQTITHFYEIFTLFKLT